MPTKLKKHETAARMQIAPYVSDHRKRRKKIRRYAFAVVGVFAFYFIFLAIVWLFMSTPFFRVQNVAVMGNSAVPSADIVSLVQATPSGKHNFIDSVFGWGNMFAWPDKVPVQNLAMIPELASITITKNYFSHSVTLNATERAPFGIWCYIPKGGSGVMIASSSSTTTEASAPDLSNEQCYWFDNTGVLFERSLSTQGNLIFVVNDFSQSPRGLNETVLPPEFNANFISVANVIRQTGLGIKEIDLNNLSLEEVDAQTTQGPRLEFSLRFPADDYLSVLKSLIAQGGFDKLQYVDCRTEDRVFYR
jgi:hypothetical protein